ncbi:ThiF family adenylyltransferase [Dankookia rubra]|nr:ThiF family adenylyltransferase [Dankookia rubra]
MAYDTNRSDYLRRLDAESNRAVLMVGAGAIGSVVLMFLIEKIF